MSTESIEVDTTEPCIAMEIAAEEGAVLWNGRGLSPLHNFDEMKRAFLLHLMNLEQTKQKFHTDVMLCGENIDGQLSVSASADTEGNKDAGVEFKVSHKEGNFSASVSGSVSQDQEGHSNGKIEIELIRRF